MRIKEVRQRGMSTAGKRFHGRCMLFAGAAGVLLLVQNVLPAAAEDSATAAVMQLMKTEGDVSVSNSSGRGISLIKNMNLYNGYRTATEEESYAWINLDSEKLAKLDAVSEAEIRKSGKKLELLLDSGNLFFNVTEDLEEDETLNIRTSTMVMGIRGTSGWVQVIDRYHSRVYLLEGEVTCVVSDPLTGQAKTTVLKSGEMAEFVVYPGEQETDRCDIIRRGYSEGEIPGMVLEELSGNDLLCRKIQDASGMDVMSYAAEAKTRLTGDQEAMRQKLSVIRGLLEEQENYISRDPVWEAGNEYPRVSPEGTPSSSPGGNGYYPEGGQGDTGSGGRAGYEQGIETGNETGPGVNAGAGTNPGNNTAPGLDTPADDSNDTDTPVAAATSAPTAAVTPAPTATATSVPTAAPTPTATAVPAATPTPPANTVTLTGDAANPVTVDDVKKAFENGAGQVVVDGPLTVESPNPDGSVSFEIPEGGELIVNGDLTVVSGSEVVVNGSLEVEGDLINDGEIIIGE